MVLNLFFVLTFFIVVFELALINFDFCIEFKNFFFQIACGFRTLVLVGSYSLENTVDSLSKFGNFTGLVLNRIDIPVDKLFGQVA
jgi:hypothetical protein